MGDVEDGEGAYVDLVVGEEDVGGRVGCFRGI